MKRSMLSAGAAVSVLVALLVPPATAAVGVDTQELRDAVTLEGIREHQAALQAIATANGGTRASGTPGYEASVGYVVDTMEDAGYDVTTQEFTYDQWSETADPVFEQVSPNPTTYVGGTDFATMEYSGSGDVTAALEAVDLVLPPGASANTSTSGCEASDFAGFTSGNVALIQRGACTFALKAQNAEAAGATAAVIFNEGQPGRDGLLNGTLGGPGIGIPVLGTTFALGNDLAAAVASDPVTVHVFTETQVVPTTTWNVLADTSGGRTDRVVLAGAHLDSVPEGPGINDNGSGSATILEIAEEMAELGIEPRNTVRFAWWGAEESGLLGSEHYVGQLTKRETKDIALNLNLDMVGSPNFVRFVYDGDGSDTPVKGPTGSAQIEDVFLDYFADMDLPTEPTAFDGRSDYGPFIAVGIPAGGLFTGAEGIKTAEQVEIYGGTAGEQFDPCYHLACDTFDNNSDEALDQMSDAAAHAVLTFAMTSSAVPGTGRGRGNAFGLLEFDGSLAQL
ncbi:MAG TPA: M20/M25/M40 family metallo-hydrolase [Actinomycetota bacterium]|nr:M20/M25/M40 family metallo-hydrolase [Actinomycetota bacterium]